MILRKLLLSVILLGGIVGCGGNTTTGNVADNKSVMSVDIPLEDGAKIDTIHLGRLHEGEIISRAFTIRNKATDPFVIVDVQTNCGCTQVRYDHNPVMPNDSTVVTFAFNSDNQWGKQIKGLDVILSENMRVKVFFDAEVIEK